MNENLKKDDQVIKLLGIQEIRRIICDTEKGTLRLVIRKGETKYFLTLDAVPLDKEKNDALMAVLFPVKEMEVPGVNKGSVVLAPDEVPVVKKVLIEALRKKGRPKGSKNKDEKGK